MMFDLPLGHGSRGRGAAEKNTIVDACLFQSAGPPVMSQGMDWFR
jgi:hypothetical protein